MYTYEKKRSDYGRQCRFKNHGPEMNQNLWPDRTLEDDWIQKNPVDKTTNETSKWSEHEVPKPFFSNKIVHGTILLN